MGNTVKVTPKNRKEFVAQKIDGSVIFGMTPIPAGVNEKGEKVFTVFVSSKNASAQAREGDYLLKQGHKTYFCRAEDFDSEYEPVE